MESHFNEPQRQSPIGVLIMFFDTLRHYIKALAPLLVLWILKFNEVNKTYIFLGISSALLIIGIVAYLKYRNFTFYLDYENEEFIINEGIFNKTKTTVQLNKIQQVNINQSLIQRIIGVYALDVDTAGSNNKEGEIKAISHPLALELKSRLLDNEKKKKPADETTGAAIEANESQPFIKISLSSLFKMGITSNYIKSFWLIVAFLGSIYNHIQEFMNEISIDEHQVDSYINEKAIFRTSVTLILILIACILMINFGRTVIKYFDYKITKQKGSLLLSFGLFNSKSTIIKPEKVQITSVSMNYFQKKMNILELKIKQATSGEKEEAKSVIEIPGCNRLERDEILKLLFNKIPQKGIMLEPNWRKLGFALFLTIGLPLIGIYYIWKWNPVDMMPLSYFATFYVIFVGAIQFFKFRNSRLFINDDFIIRQSGAWDISNEIIEPSKIQAITTSQLFWHKSINIGSITLHTAGGNISFQLGNYDMIKHYVNLWLYEIETSDSNWM